MREMMKNTTSIFIATCVLLVTTMSHMPVWKCLINGDLLLSPGCTIEAIVQDCCNSRNDNSNSLQDSDCCEKIHSSQNFNLDNVQPNLTGKERKVLDFNPAFIKGDYLYKPLKEAANFFNNLPPPEKQLFLSNTPLHISLCSFIC